ncbi:hypothetical protein SLEP1_g43700 [Rubroshorea leprosula]|uniref:Fe2OG dioxygenase domain-containing protein n=1 Tax=Rubroshorea leprosula TaxID=152421 RepID=A0AAV5LEM6_9ROSI|nr:hypothetical protein SLEP1_g43700 [Rubroshorea leprosula]
MAAATSPPRPGHSPDGATFIKALAESGSLTSVPSNYIFTNDPLDQAVSDPEESIPIIDLSSLTSGSPDQRSKAICDLGKACQEWGFFMVINHGVSESLIEMMMDSCRQFFDLTEEEKKEFQGKHVLDPIRCGTSFNLSVDKVLFWRDYLKVFVHPEFHSPNKPPNFSDNSMEYCKIIHQVARELLKGISESLGLEALYIDKAMNLDLGFQILIANLYPACPVPELAMGIPPHSDHGLLTILIQNGVDGLQLLHKGKWVNVKAVPNSFLVNTADHIEILSNGKYKSVMHRAVVNSEVARISLAVANGPSLDTVVRPAEELVDDGDNQPAYVGMKYREYLQLQQSNQLDGKSCLDRVMVSCN